ncbi:pyridoxamine 5'-phosphate oxidase family protein [Halobium salinum]|uniref:Pyridoxamine 5'-phosphate oxidase family protein n=1 Tax=Halobium salinum TaxID=1364940 RepID=A0ABD5PAF8_9EURY|nr:pyridoxamine 5'-phosphate oxidase family protein [Halobium salinum]
MTDPVPDAVADLLADARSLAHLATCRDGRPHAAPVWFHYDADDEAVELVTTGRKLSNLRANPRVSLSVAREREGMPEWSVTLLGTASVVEDADATRAANRRINRKYGVDEDAWAGENTLVRVDVGSATVQRYD